MIHTCHRIVPGPGTFFLTVRLRDADSDLLTRHIELLRLSVRLCQFRHPFVIDDAVVLPDRLHALWSLPQDDVDVASRMQLIKSTFARHLPAATHPHPRDPIWQRAFWDFPVRTLADLAECRQMIRHAPVRAGLVTDPADWPYSTASRAGRASTRTEKVVPFRVIDGMV